MSDLSQILQALGQVQGKLETLESNQQQNTAQVQGSIVALHAKVDSITAEVHKGQEKLFREGCVRAQDHVDHENRIRQVEDWKITHDTEAKTVAATSGGIYGGGISMLIMAIEFVFQHMGKK